MKLKIINSLILIFIFNLYIVFAQDDSGINDYTSDNPYSEKCKEEMSKYQDCIESLSTYYSEDSSDSKVTKDDLDKFCNTFEENKCKDFVDDVNIATSVCLSSNSEATTIMDRIVGFSILAIKVNYLALCVKDTNNKVCPLSEYIINNLISNKELDFSENITDEEKSIITNDCKNSKCNERMLAISNIMESMLALTMGSSNEGNVAAVSNKTIFNYKVLLEQINKMKQTTKEKREDEPNSSLISFSLFSDNILENYKTKKCFSTQEIDDATLNEGSDITIEFNSKECMNELSKYQDCIESLSTYNSEDSSDSKVTKDDLDKFCNTFEENKCKDFVDDVNIATSVCLSSNSEATTIMDRIVGFSILAIKVNYLALCVKDTNNKVCPLSEYIINNLISNKELDFSENITDEEKSIITNDCKNSKCNERMLAISNIMESMLALTMGSSNEGNVAAVSNKTIFNYKVLLEQINKMKQTTKEKREDEPNSSLISFSLFSDNILENYKTKKCFSTQDIDDATLNEGSDKSTTKESGEKDKDSSSITIQNMTFSTIIFMFISILILI